MKETLLKISLIVLLILITQVRADHSADLPGYNPNRGYNKDSCELMISKTTGSQGEWLGHSVGCLVEDGASYVLVMEYMVRELTAEKAEELKGLARKYPEEKDPAPSGWTPI